MDVQVVLVVSLKQYYQSNIITMEKLMLVSITTLEFNFIMNIHLITEMMDIKLNFMFMIKIKILKLLQPILI